ncbi:MAG: hypothetical protein NTX79_06580 [Candidatus Micrarchaeota archaeon]|nr:hypothetical protein [Candidatus Micrarchaeota archaeon]
MLNSQSSGNGQAGARKPDMKKAVEASKNAITMACPDALMLINMKAGSARIDIAIRGGARYINFGEGEASRMLNAVKRALSPWDGIDVKLPSLSPGHMREEFGGGAAWFTNCTLTFAQPKPPLDFHWAFSGN